VATGDPFFDDNREQEADALITQLVWKGWSLERVVVELEKRGLGNQLPASDVERRHREASSARELMRRPTATLPRIVGTISLLGGLAALALRIATPGIPFILGRRWSVGGYGLLAVILGLILIIWPQKAREKL